MKLKPAPGQYFARLECSQAAKVWRDHGCRKTLAGADQEIPAAEIDCGGAEGIANTFWFLRAQSYLRCARVAEINSRMPGRQLSARGQQLLTAEIAENGRGRRDFDTLPNKLDNRPI
jgi:hypothetical protein